jgi:meso-butanediol dehydrogenase/(S,S)-butanediol dehydrogenase/diacetyl reductase
MADLSDKVAVVTGGSRGIGRAIVECLSDAGAAVTTCGRGARPADLADSVGWLTMDVAESEQVVALKASVEERFGPATILVNNAGIQVEKTVTESDDEDWDLVIGTNCRGVFNCCRAFIPGMEIAGGGSIINIGSISGVVADPGLALYNASKAFVHGLTRSIAVDHGPAVRCNAIRPGWIMTGMADAAFAVASDVERAKRDALSRHAAGRFGEPADIAKAALWLASDEAAFVTGQCISVDGGLTAASPLQPGLF